VVALSLCIVSPASAAETQSRVCIGGHGYTRKACTYSPVVYLPGRGKTTGSEKKKACKPPKPTGDREAPPGSPSPAGFHLPTGPAKPPESGTGIPVRFGRKPVGTGRI